MVIDVYNGFLHFIKLVGSNPEEHKLQKVVQEWNFVMNNLQQQASNIWLQSIIQQKNAEMAKNRPILHFCCQLWMS